MIKVLICPHKRITLVHPGPGLRPYPYTPPPDKNFVDLNLVKNRFTGARSGAPSRYTPSCCGTCFLDCFLAQASQDEGLIDKSYHRQSGCPSRPQDCGRGDPTEVWSIDPRSGRSIGALGHLAGLIQA